MDAVRWGIIATGGIARAFAEDLALLPDATLAAVASRSPESAQAFAATHGAARSYGSWAELAADPEVDVVYIATPHPAHHAAALLCLRAGKAVLCEKPLTLDHATALELVETARDAGLFFMEAMWMRTNPVIRELVDRVSTGDIGDVHHLSADFGLPGPPPPDHRLRALELGGGALLDLGVYPVTFAQLFLGTPSSVKAWASLSPEGADQNTGLVLGHPSGAVATLYCGFLGHTGQRAVITGSRGRVEIDQHFYRPVGYRLVSPSGAAEEVTLTLRGNGLGYEAEEVMRCLRAGLTESPLVPLNDTLAVMATLDEARAQVGVTYPA